MNVTTINGEVVLKKNARRIKGINGEFGYYKIGNIAQKNSGDCYQINNIYYTVEKERIAWDYNLNTYALKSTLIEGIVRNSLGDTLGYFSKNDNTIKIFKDKSSHVLALNKKVALELGYIEGLNNNFYDMSSFTYADLFPREEVSREYKNTLDYNLLQDKIKKTAYVLPKTDDYLENIYKNYKSIFDKYSFGVEMETLRGLVPTPELERLNVSPLRDGSINGLEYVSAPLQGKAGVYNFKEMLENIIKYTDSDYSCSMHVHVGGVPRTPSFITAAFKINYLIQNDLYRMFPDYKNFHTGVKRKCYTLPLETSLMMSLKPSKKPDEINQNCTKLISHLTSYISEYQHISLENVESHPRDPGNSSKWNITERYKFFNLIPLIFTNKQTIEYRIFTQPDTIDKGLSFLLLSLVITDYIVKHQEYINSTDKLDMCLWDILSGYSRGIYDAMRTRNQSVTQLKSSKGAFFEEESVKLHEYLYPAKQYNNLKKSWAERMIEMQQMELRPSLRTTINVR